jgi:hypothetical protein
MHAVLFIYFKDCRILKIQNDDIIVSKHVVNLKIEIIKAYGVVCMTEMLKSK